MRTIIDGVYHGRMTKIEITDGVITEGKNEPAAAMALGVVRAGAQVSIPGVWSGTANLDDPWAIRALFGDLLVGAVFSGDEPPSLTVGDPPGVIY